MCRCLPCKDDPGLAAVCECKQGSAEGTAPAWVPVPFEVGTAQFPAGDSVVIEEILGTHPVFVDGGTYKLRGRYTLASRDRALMEAWNMNGKRDGGPVSMVIERGSGRFEFTFRP